MLKNLCIALAAGIAASAVAQTPARPDAVDPKASAPAQPYESAFKGYRPYAEPEPARWRDVNDEVGRLNGHAGHVPRALPPKGAAGPAAKPPAPGHGAHK